MNLNIRICFFFGVALIGIYFFATGHRYERLTELWTKRTIYTRVFVDNSTEIEGELSFGDNISTETIANTESNLIENAETTSLSEQNQVKSTQKTVTTSTETTKRTKKLIQVQVEWIDMKESRDYSDYGDGTCPENECKLILSEILKRWEEIARKLKITYFFTCGSLLGAWRDGQLVPKDTDMDILISRKDATKLERVRERRSFNNYDGKFHLYMQRDWRNPYERRRRFKCNGKQVKAYSDQCSFQEPLGRLMKDGHHLDIYDYTIKDGLLIDPSEGYHEFKLKDVFPLKKCNFLGLTGLCPNNPKNFLKSFYNKLKTNKKCVNQEWVNVK